MVQLTSDATDHLRRVRRERGFGETEGVRFVQNSGRIALTFVKEPAAGDSIMGGESLPVYVSSDVAGTLDDAVIDARAEDGKVGLVIRRHRKTKPRPA